MSSLSNFFGFKRPRPKGEKKSTLPRDAFDEGLQSAYHPIVPPLEHDPYAARPGMNSPFLQNSISTGSPLDVPTTPTSVAHHSRVHISPFLGSLPLVGMRSYPPSFPIGHDPTNSTPLSQGVTGVPEYISPLSITNSHGNFPGPPIEESEIGVKFPSHSYGPGIERRVFVDPTFKKSKQAERLGHGAGGLDCTVFSSRNSVRAAAEAACDDGDEEEFPFSRDVRDKNPELGGLAAIPDRSRRLLFAATRVHDLTTPCNHSQAQVASSAPSVQTSVVHSFENVPFQSNRSETGILNPLLHESSIANSENSRLPFSADKEIYSTKIYEDKDEHDEKCHLDFGEKRQYSFDNLNEQALSLDCPDRDQPFSSEEDTGPSQSPWSPRVSIDHGVTDMHEAFEMQEVLTKRHHLIHSSKAPNQPQIMEFLHLPSSSLQSHGLGGPHPTFSISEPQSRLAESYGNARHLLGLPLSQPSLVQSYRGSSLMPNLDAAVDPMAQNIVENHHAVDVLTSYNLNPASLGQKITRNVLNKDYNIASPHSSHARLSFIGSDGSIYSRPISEVETEMLRTEIHSHILNHSEVKPQSLISYGHGAVEDAHFHVGRLSIEFSDHEGGVDLGPGRSQSSSSIDEEVLNDVTCDPCEEFSGRVTQRGFYRNTSTARVRNGTPPGLYGTRVMASERDPFSSTASNINCKGRLARVMQEAGLKNDSRLARVLEGDSDYDWETEADGSNISRQMTQIPIAGARAGSSLADNSDSGSLPSKLTKESSDKQVIPRSTHPRYSWSILKNKRSGEVVVTPDHELAGSSWVPNRIVTTPTKEPSSSLYRHTTPFSKENGDTFESSSSSINLQQTLPLVRECQSPTSKKFRLGPGALRLIPKTPEKPISTDHLAQSQHTYKTQISTHNDMIMKDDGCEEALTTFEAKSQAHSLQSSTWLSTADGAATNEHIELQSSQGIFNKTNTAANVTGAPDGTGAREVGSSLAGGSSPPDVPFLGSANSSLKLTASGSLGSSE